ncbi:inorganic phosphate transporter [Campylobacter sp. RM16192]|uniref:inorganic phosphate transporter n=1 Tax=Campylobacter sp. RM16192 TaxID=1660080 RepID=UPI0014525BB4|nr:inorganic phosphate transporter [Campylobacter sp. RM16192]QCD52709.1 inorganic phosphate transporter, PitA family [Campylobacter sp. RM16192]
MSRDNLFAFILFSVATIGFFIWGYEYIPSHHFLLFLIASIFGIFMAFNIGGNDVANSFGTSVGAKTVTIKQALIIAAVFELSGAIFAGGEVTKTIREGIIRFPETGIDPMLFVLIMMSALLSSGLWLFIASKKGLPISTTHSIVGGIVGAGLTMGFMTMDGKEALGMVSWQGIGRIAISWVISPLLGGILSYSIYSYIKTRIINPTRISTIELKKLKKERKSFKEQYLRDLKTKPAEEQIRILSKIAIIDEENIDAEKSEYKMAIKSMKEREKTIDTFRAMRKHIPIVAAVGAIIISAMMLFKGLKHLNFDVGLIGTIWIICVIGIVTYLATLAMINVMSKSDAEKSTNRIFSWFQIFTASSFAFSHGANDIANAVGPFAAILDVLKTGSINATAPIPNIAMITFGIALVVGLWFLGKEVIMTIGSKLAEILPTTGFSAELGASAVILFATKLGIPVSSTHILIGAVLGIGVFNKDANWAMVKPIVLAWVITLPIAGGSAAIIYVILKSILGL